MQDILGTVAEFARGVAARSEGGERYDALCAAFLLDVVRRELIAGDGPERRQREQLGTLTGTPAGGHLYADFCARVRSGSLDADWEKAFDFALAQVIDKVAVTNPDYLEPMHRA
ncbi:MAG: DUF6285 domain-containing protein [Porticoccaceae bacterium]